MTVPESLAIQVLLFARYAEAAGVEAMTVEVPAGSTVAAVLERVRIRLSRPEGLPPRPLVALNRSQTDLLASVKDGDELAILPPVAGG
jgi:molybdopterin synthase catalytic subunit